MTAYHHNIDDGAFRPGDMATQEEETEAERAQAHQDALIDQARRIAREELDVDPTVEHVAALIRELDEALAELRSTRALRIEGDFRRHDLVDAVYEAGRSVGLVQGFGESTRSYLLRIALTNTTQGGVK